MLLLLGAIGIYFAVGACVLRFGLNSVLFPRTAGFPGPAAEALFSVKNSSNSELLVRRYGQARAGCVLFFPGQHGAAAAYDFTSFTAAGLAVFVMAYPGQDGASGRTSLGEIGHLVDRAITIVQDTCRPDQTVLVGVSLGAMLAAYARHSPELAGLVLSSAAPSLSSALRVRLRSHLALAPLALLPLSRLLPHDYSLSEGLGRSPAIRVIIFQGTHDEQTPLELLRGNLPPRVQLTAVPEGTHSTAFALSQRERLSTILDMLSSRGDTA